jgi:hypothetical protein
MHCVTRSFTGPLATCLYDPSISGSIVQQDCTGATFQWVDLCKCKNEMVDGLDREGLGLRKTAISLILVPSCFLAKISVKYRLGPECFNTLPPSQQLHSFPTLKELQGF